MKICIITFEFPPKIGGIGSASNRIAHYFKDQDNEIHVFTVSGKDTHFVNAKKEMQTEDRDGLIVHTMSPYAGTLTHCPPQEIQNCLYFLEQLHKKHDFDTFHGFRINAAGFLATILSKKFNKKSIVSSRGNDIDRDIYDSEVFPRIKWTLENADKLTFVSNKQLELADFFIPCKEKSRVILNSLNPKEFYAIEPKEIPLKGFVVGFVGTVRRKKGFAYLLEAFSKFNKERESTLLIIGKLMEDERQVYEKMIAESGVQDKITITGDIPHKYILNYINMIDAFVLPSISEGCPNALLEAMYCKKPCIVTGAGAMSEIIKHQENGTIIRKHSSLAIFEALNNVKENTADPGEKASNTIKEDFLPEREIKEWLEVLK